MVTVEIKSYCMNDTYISSLIFVSHWADVRYPPMFSSVLLYQIQSTYVTRKDIFVLSLCMNDFSTSLRIEIKLGMNSMPLEAILSIYVKFHINDTDKVVIQVWGNSSTV
jgi:hypothetical protein